MTVHNFDPSPGPWCIPQTPYPPPPPAVHGQTHQKKNPGCRYIQVCIHTLSFLIQTPNQSLKQWENGTSGHKAKATNLQNGEFLCFEFLRLVELLSDTVCCVNLRNFLGIYATFLGNLRRFGGKIYTHLHNVGAGGRKACKSP